jgi:hypothetical protein
MNKFDKLAEEHGLDILTKEQTEKVLSSIHKQGFARAKRIAYSNGWLLIEGGNLDYYAGLEYCRPEETYAGGYIKLYYSKSEDQVDRVIRKCNKAQYGE